MEGKGRHQRGLSFNIEYYFNQEVLLSFSLFGPFTDQNDRFPCTVNVHFHYNFL